MEVDLIVVSINRDLPKIAVLRIVDALKKVEGVEAVKTLERIVFEMHEQ